MLSNDKIAIKVKNISKRYRIGVKEELHDSFGGTLIDLITRPVKNFCKLRSLYRFDEVVSNNDEDPEKSFSNIIWALRDISFEVKKGEVLGVIGKNGAGKSTLLKILSKITDPSRGKAEIRGRVSSLLEVGTGFHPELTGRENVYLNGTILGMTKKEIDKKFDEIVDFSDIKKFIDTPVKRYSSGMQVRLAFSVAAYLEREIMIIDEVLAVGDAAFQKKCLSKMEDTSHSGKTVLFVSHNMAAITRICSRAILLENGRAIADGPSHEVVKYYLDAGEGAATTRRWHNTAKAPGDDIVHLQAVRAWQKDRLHTEAMDIRLPIGLEMEYEIHKTGFIFMLYFRVWNQEGIELFNSIENTSEWRGKSRPAGRYVSTAWIPGNYLAEGMVYVTPCMRTLNPMVRRFTRHDVDEIAFQVIDSMEGDSARGDHASELGGVVRPMLKWETRIL